VAVSQRDTRGGFASLSVAIAKPTGTADGDLLVAAVFGQAPLAAPPGWTPIRDTTHSAPSHLATFFKIAAGEGATFTFTCGASTVLAIVTCFAGFAGTPVLDAESGATNAASTAACAPSVPTTAANALLVFVKGTSSGAATTPPAGMTEPTNGEQANLLELAYQLDAGAAGATGDKTATLGTATANSCHLAAFVPSAAPTAVAGTDAAAAAATEAATVLANPIATDAATLVPTEAHTLAVAAATDAGALAATETRTLAATATAGDAGPVAAAEAAAIASSVAATEAAPLAGTETATALPVGGTTPTGADAGLLAATEGALVLAVVAPRNPQANPALLLAPLSGSLAATDRSGALALTGAGAVRYLPAQNARTNYVPNPRFAVDTTGWSVLLAGGTAAITRVTTDGVSAQTSLRIDADTVNGGVRLQTTLARVPGAVPLVLSFWIKLLSGAADWVVRSRDGTANASAFGLGTNLNLTATGQWQRISYPYTVLAGMSIAGLELLRRTTAAGSLLVTDVVIEPTPGGATSFDGASAGAAWINPATGVPGTAQASPSVSAAAAFVEEATTNGITNPSFETATTGWDAVGSTISRDTTYAYVGAAALKVVTANATVAEGVRVHPTQVPAAAGQTWTAAVWLRGAGDVQVQLAERDAGGTLLGSSAQSGITLTDAWRRFAISRTLLAGGSTNVTLDVVTTGQQAATFWLDAAQLEQKAYATSYADGSLGPGYAWSGTAHASTSTRAATTVKGDETARIDPQRGAVALWFYRETDTGGSQFFLNVGDLGAGKDRVGLRLSSGDALLSEWTSNGGAVKTTIRAGATATGAWLFAYGEWDGMATAVAIGTEAPTPGTRDAPSGNLSSANDLNVGTSTSATGHLDGRIGPAMIFDRPLTAAERTALFTEAAWTFDRFATSDAGTVGATEAATVLVALAAADAGLLAATEATAAAALVAAADVGLVVAASEPKSIEAALARTETVAFAAAETAAAARAIAQADPAPLAVAEAASVLAIPHVPIAGAELGRLSDVEAAAIVRLVAATWTAVPLVGTAAWQDSVVPVAVGWVVVAPAGFVRWALEGEEGMATLEVRRGDRRAWILSLRDPQGAPFPLANTTVWWTVRPNVPAAPGADPTDAEALIRAWWKNSGGATLTSGVVGPDGASGGTFLADDVAQGVLNLVLLPRLTTQLPAAPPGGGQWQYDVQVEVGNNPDDVRTFDDGTLRVIADVTRRTSVP
jgi:hypothetical protein